VDEVRPSTGQSITLDELIALNAEMAALVRAGVPMAEGLSRLSCDLEGRLGRMADQLGDQLSCGQSLPQALASQGIEFPPVYQAVVDAGLRSGNLASTLETVASNARRMADARRSVVASLIYPIFVFLLAWGLFVFFTYKLAPALLFAFRGSDSPAEIVLGYVSALGATSHYWGPIVPIVLMALFVWWIDRSSRATLLEPAVATPLLGWLPWLGPMVRTYRQAAFADSLRLLVQHDVPLPEAVRLAATATCTAKMQQSAERIAGAVERGEPLGGQVEHLPGFPPILEWLLRSGHDRGTLEAALRHAADTYHRRAIRLAQSAQLFLPPLATLLIGGSVTCVYLALTIGTWISMLQMAMSW